jgi:hypothetical protein
MTIIMRLRSTIITLAFVLIFPLAGCVTFNVGTISPPPAGAKLRIYVQPISSASNPTAMAASKKNAGFAISHEEYAEKQLRTVRKYLEETGIYEVISAEDVDAVIGDQALSWNLLQGGDWALARKIGKALHAEYAMIMERSKALGAAGSKDFVFTNVLINTETGQKFGARYRVIRNIRAEDAERRRIIGATYEEIFRNAKEDLLATAMQKAGRIKEVKKVVAEAPRSEPARAPQAPAREVMELKKTEPPAPVKEPLQTAALPTETPKPTPSVQAKLPEPTPRAEPVRAVQVSTQAPASAIRESKNTEKPAADYIKDVNEREGLLQAASASGAPKLVVYDLEASENYKPAALIIADALREEIFQLRCFVLVNRENLQQMLQEMALQQTGLIDEKEAVKTGKGLAANQVVMGRMGMLGTVFVLQAKRVDVETLATLGLASARFAAGHEDEVMLKLPEFAKHLAGLP